MRTHEVQKCFLKNNRDPRPIKFFMKFNYRSKSTGIRDYELRLNDVLQEDPYSENLSELKKKWEAGEYKDDWANYEDEKNNRKADKKVKKRKRQAHVIFHEKLDEKLDGKKLSDATVVSSLPSTSSVSSSTSNRRKQSPEELRGYEEEDEDGASSSASKKARKEENPTSNVYSELAHQIIPRTDSSESSKVINDEERMVKNDEELELYAKESIRDDEEKWFVCGTDLCNALTKWKQKKARPRTDLGFYDIVDITPGSNSDFVRSLPIDVVREIRQSKHCQQLKMDDTDGMKKYIVNFIKAKDFRKLVDESYMKTRINNHTKFIWDYLNILVESFERDNDLAEYNLSELGYREIFLAPLMRSLFRGMHREMNVFFGEKCLFASSEDRNLEKNDEEDRSAGRKIDIIWSMKPTDLEFSICEVSGPPNQHNHTHFFNDKLKIAKMLKVILNRIVRKYGSVGINLTSLKLYGLHVYYNEITVYEMSIPSGGLYVFCEVLRSKLPTNEFEVGLLLRSVPALLKFRMLLEESLTDLKDYIQDACTRTPDDNGNAGLFITHTDLTPKTNRKQSN